MMRPIMKPPNAFAAAMTAAIRRAVSVSRSRCTYSFRNVMIAAPTATASPATALPAWASEYAQGAVTPRR